MSLIKDERYLIVQPRDDGVLMGLYGTVDPHVKCFSYPERIVNQYINRGIVMDWSPILKLWFTYFHIDMGISISAGFNPIMFLKPATYSKLDTQIVTKFWFEKCNVPGLFVWPASVATLMGASLTSGIVIDVGLTHIEIVPVYECSVLQSDIVILPYGLLDAIGNNNKHAYKLATTTEIPNLYTPTLNTTTTPITVESITLQEGIVVSGQDRIHVANTLATNIVSGILQCLTTLQDLSFRVLLSDAMMVSGLLFSIAHLDVKLEHELNKLLVKSKQFDSDSQPSQCCFRIISAYLEAYTHRPELAAYLGGSLLSMAIFNDTKNFITRADYEKYGPRIVHVKNYGASTV